MQEILHPPPPGNTICLYSPLGPTSHGNADSQLRLAEVWQQLPKSVPISLGFRSELWATSGQPRISPSSLAATRRVQQRNSFPATRCSKSVPRSAAKDGPDPSEIGPTLVDFGPMSINTGLNLVDARPHLADVAQSCATFGLSWATWGGGTIFTLERRSSSIANVFVDGSSTHCRVFVDGSPTSPGLIVTQR